MKRFKTFTEASLGRCKTCGAGLRKNRKNEISCGNTSCDDYNKPVK